MSEKLNESLLDLIEKEGEAERFWDILARFEDDPKSSIDDMFPLADHGSTLTLYFIGDILLWGYKGIHNVKEGLICLQRAADQGSLEAIYQIGRAYYAWGKIPEAIEHFDYLSKKGFSPAMYSLAALYSYQKYGDNYKELSFIYYNMAAKHGNILARKNLSLKMIRGDFGLKKIFNGILMWITVIWPYRDS